MLDHAAQEPLDAVPKVFDLVLVEPVQLALDQFRNVSELALALDQPLVRFVHFLLRSRLALLLLYPFERRLLFVQLGLGLLEGLIGLDPSVESEADRTNDPDIFVDGVLQGEDIVMRLMSKSINTQCQHSPPWPMIARATC